MRSHRCPKLSEQLGLVTSFPGLGFPGCCYKNLVLRSRNAQDLSPRLSCFLLLWPSSVRTTYHCWYSSRPEAFRFKMSAPIASTTVVERSSTESKRDYAHADDSIHDPEHLPSSPYETPEDIQALRPPLDYSSPSAFFRSVGRRFASIWTKRFVLSLLAGQVVSLCITCTNVTTTELVMRNWALPTTQTFFL